jgi:hypothetical protein
MPATPCLRSRAWPAPTERYVTRRVSRKCPNELFGLKAIKQYEKSQHQIIGPFLPPNIPGYG